MSGALDLRSLCSFSTGTLLWQQRPDEWALSLCIKGTFALVPGSEAVLADVQRVIQDGGDVSVSAPGDIVPIKPRADVLVFGGADAPVDVRVRVGGVDKRLAIAGGAVDLGSETFARRASEHGLSDAARAWAEEALSGTPSGAAPADLDFGVFNEAPSDQQGEVLRRREELVLHGVLKGDPEFEGRLPGLWPKVLQFPPRGMPEEVGLRCDTLLVDADHGLAILWWRGLIPVPRGDLGALGTIVVVAEEVSQRARVEVIEAWVRTPGAAPPASFVQERVPALASPLAQRHKKKPSVDDLEGATIKLPSPLAVTAKVDVEVTANALPAALLRPALPFVAPPILAPAIAAPPVADPPPSPDVEPPRLGPSLLLTESTDVAQVATLAAKLASGSAKTILATRGLAEQTWRSVERRCLERLADEAEQGGTDLRDEYDEAFLAAEALRRGPFELEHLARFRVDLEMGEPQHEDAELALDIAAAMRTRRLAARRAAADPALAKSLDAAMAKERDRRRAR
jgi:uncharacterized protein DUF2169